MANQKTIKPQILERAVVQLDHIVVKNLLNVLSNIENSNPMFPPSMAKFIAKNQQKLLRRHELNSFAEKELRERYSEFKDYPERDEEGRDLFWDGVEDNIVYKDNPLAEVGAISDKVVDEEKSVFGVKAWVEGGTYKLFDCKTEKEITGPARLKLSPYIKDVGQRKVYEEKLKEMNVELDAVEKTKHDVHVLRISTDYMEETRIAVPPTFYNSQMGGKQKLDLISFYEYLTIQDAEDLEEEAENTNHLEVVK